MYIVDGICYAGEFQNDIKVAQAKLLQGKTMLVTFTTGERRLFDTTSLEGGAFEPLSDEAILENFSIFHGIVSWLEGEIDIAPEFLYLNSIPYSEEAA